nr:EOG090X027R [Eulimnadia texana]
MDPVSEMNKVAATPWFGVMDVILLAGMAGFGVYWVYFRNKDKPTLISAPASDNSFITKMKNTGRNVVVFYGSQTGTAEEFAGRLAKEAARYGMKALIADPEECEMEELTKLSEIENSLAVFCLATYGEGDPTDNAQAFYEWLQAGDADLSNINYAVFGLGNKTYEHYNAMGKYVDKRMAELGASRVVELGLGDDDGNMEEDFITWKEKFWPALLDFFGLELKLQDVSMRQYKLVTPAVSNDKVFTGEVARLKSYVTQRPPFDAKNPFLAPVVAWKELHKAGDRSCMHIEFDISHSKLRYDAGDHVAVYPANDSELVNKFGELLNVDLDTVISLVNIDGVSETVHITAVLVKYTTPTGRINKGVATTWLSQKKPQPDTPPQLAPVFIRKSQFRLPARPQTPIIMIGPGTGVAPFRGFIQERHRLKEEGKPVGETILFFGCRNRAEDFLYEDELQTYVAEGTLQLHVAFSREQLQKVYVTHLLKESAADVWRILGKENGHIYVCGDARNMARDVHDIIVNICREHGGMSESEALQYVKKLETQRRYSADVWS